MAQQATWLYLKSEAQLWTVGFYDPSGKWHAESDHHSPNQAAARVNYLNGGSRSADLLEACQAALAYVRMRGAGKAEIASRIEAVLAKAVGHD